MHSEECSVEGCEGGILIRNGLCNKHRIRLQRHGDVNHTRPTPQRKLPCTIEGCDQLRTGRGLCAKHYSRFKVHGSPDVVSRHVEKHGMLNHPLYATWSMMRHRCYDPNATRYERYGGRGIEVCDRWRYSFAAFVEDVGERPEGYTLDRIDSDGNYQPDNVRWSSRSTQQKNQGTRRNNTSGHKGVTWDARRSRWRAYWNDRGVRIELGSFDDFDDAVNARHNATVHDLDVICCAELNRLRSAA